MVHHEKHSIEDLRTNTSVRWPPFRKRRQNLPLFRQYLGEEPFVDFLSQVTQACSFYRGWMDQVHSCRDRHLYWTIQSSFNHTHLCDFRIFVPPSQDGRYILRSVPTCALWHLVKLTSIATWIVSIQRSQLLLWSNHSHAITTWGWSSFTNLCVFQYSVKAYFHSNLNGQHVGWSLKQSVWGWSHLEHHQGSYSHHRK